MFSRLKIEVLTDEEKRDLKLEISPDYAVRFTNKSGEVMYVAMRESLKHMQDDIYSRKVDFKLYDVNLQCLEETFAFGYEDSWERLSTSQALKKAATEVKGNGKELYAKAAQVAADMERKKEELKQKQTIAEQKEKREKSVAFHAVKKFFGR